MILADTTSGRYVKQIVDDLHPKEFTKLVFQGYIYNSQIIRIFDDRGNNTNGYVPLPPRRTKINKNKSIELPQGDNYPIAEQTKNYFIKFVKTAVESGAKVYVYMPPILEKINEEFLNTAKAD